MTLSWITLQGHFTELVCNVGKNKRNEVRPGKVSVTSLSVQNTMSSGGSGTTEVMANPWRLVGDCSKRVQLPQETRCLFTYFYLWLWKWAWPSMLSLLHIVVFWYWSVVCVAAFTYLPEMRRADWGASLHPSMTKHWRWQSGLQPSQRSLCNVTTPDENEWAFFRYVHLFSVTDG